MLKKRISPLLIVIAVVILTLYGNASGFFESRLQAPETSPVAAALPTDWAAARLQRKNDIQQHLIKHQENYDHFANFPVSQTQGIPLIVLKLLPKLAPELWGSDDNFLSVMGLFNDERLQGYPFPRGIGFTGLVRKQAHDDIDYASFTCGGCHIGRIRFDDGHYEYLDGGINSEFNVIGYRQRIVQTLNKLYGTETDRDKKNKIIIEAILSALEQVQNQDPDYFYNNYSHTTRNFNQDYETKQIALFKQDAANIIIRFIEHQERVYDGWLMIAKKFYPTIEQRIGSGFAGMEDAIGFNAAAVYQNLNSSRLTRLFAPLALPSAHGVTDIMAVWEQDTHDPRWNEDKTRLINGGGQWNGHIPLPIYKNIAAQITLGFDDIDISVSAHSERLLKDLPAPLYPFEVNLELAEKGRLLFAENCAACHQPNNGKVYTQMGTDMGRAKIAGTIITVGAQSSFAGDKNCSPETTIEMEGVQVQPCAAYRGVSLKGQSKQVMLPPRIHNGYNALPLPGLWAQAPYLHNGSVPTLYHMLVPSERPAVFVKSRLDYDQHNVGFNWRQDNWTDKTEGYIYDTTASPATSHAGHDRDITENGKTYKLNWSDDKASAWALIEYLKTL
ncbi:MAG: cytochrome c [Gammaproteobacteria bacterium]|nr:cytochrome c [Gammaproteobacteria bacterium]